MQNSAYLFIKDVFKENKMREFWKLLRIELKTNWLKTCLDMLRDCGIVMIFGYAYGYILGQADYSLTLTIFSGIALYSLLLLVKGIILNKGNKNES